jgi:hypothetical protein
MTKTIGDGDQRDFDETRRLLYMSLVAAKTKKYNLVGTLVNALVHHHAVDGLNPDEAAQHIINVVEGADTDVDGTVESSRAWVQTQVNRITAELGD